MIGMFRFRKTRSALSALSSYLDCFVMSGIGCFFEWTNATTAATLDLGDQLLAGEELLLPTLLGFT